MSDTDEFVPPRRSRPIPLCETEYARYDDPREDARFFVEMGQYVDKNGRPRFACNVFVTKETASNYMLLAGQQ